MIKEALLKDVNACVSDKLAGLDNYWVNPVKADSNFSNLWGLLGDKTDYDSKTYDAFKSDIAIPDEIGPALSSATTKGFRGKGYSEMMQAVTGKDLYSTYIDNEDVLHMSDALSKTNSKELAKKWDLPVRELNMLKNMFKQMGQQGASLISEY